MPLTLDQALKQLRALTNPTVDQLRAIVNQLDVSLVNGASTTLLYSGDIGRGVSGITVTVH